MPPPPETRSVIVMLEGTTGKESGLIADVLAVLRPLADLEEACVAYYCGGITKADWRLFVKASPLAQRLIDRATLLRAGRA